MSYGLLVEYQKYKLLKEKKKEISMWGYKGLFLVILIYLSGMIITIQKKSSPQYHNGKKLARYMLLYPFIAIVLYLWLKYNGLLF